MANRDNAGGFRPAKNLIGNRVVEMLFPVDSSNGTNVFIGDVMAANAAGSVRPAAADIGTSAAGVVVALYDTNKIPIGAPGAAVTTKYLPSSTAGYALIALALPGTVFIAQAQTGQTPAQADIFATTDHVAGTGDTTTCRSKHELNFSDKNTGAQFLILGKVDEPNNSYAEHADIYVTFHESIFGIVDKSVGV